MKLLTKLMAAGLALGAAMSYGQEASEGLKVGDKAPDFMLMGSDGKEHSLGERGVVLAWFPKAFTAG